MSYLVLARKYRPKNFAEVMGQSHILKALTHALETNQLHHAYLFTGTHGTGKTSLARILAKCLLCETGITANPCNQCLNCQEIDQGRFLDVLEIDAASRTKVEDTRDLLDNIQYAPQRGRFKIYIIDEVHMLSGHSFNALLKTLEEPPPHVKFLLATTDPQKLPVTVLSRCLQFHLKNMSVEQIISQCEIILPKENISYEKEALELIAKSSQGSMRDALSLLDQAIAHGQGSVKEINVAQMLGTVREEKIRELLELIHANNQEELLKLINQFEENNADFYIILDNLLSLFIKLALKPEKYAPEDIQLYYQIGLLGKRDLPLAPDPKSGFIMTMIRMCVFTPCRGGERRSPDNSSNQRPSNNNLPNNNSSNEQSSIQKSSIARPSVAPTETTNWQLIINQLNLSGVAQLLAQNCVITKQDEQTIELTLDQAHAALLTPLAKDKFIEALKNHYKKPCQITITIGKSSLETPHQQKTRENTEKIKAAEKALMADTKVQSLMQTFSAKLVSDPLIEE